MNSKSIFVLKLSVFTIFIARAYQHFFWDVPYRAILWYENLMRPILSWFGIDWEEFVSNTETDTKIQWIIKGIGILYFITSILVLAYNQNSKKWIKVVITIITIWQFLVVFLFTKESFFQIGQYFEHSLQLGMPVLLLYTYSKSFSLSKALVFLKVLVGLTFLCHGLYALGFYPVPGNFIDMTISIVGLTEEQARSFLWVAGIIDVFILPLLFLKKIAKATAIYAVFWGFLTAFARITANFSADFPLETLHQYGFETVVRLCHGLGPLLIIFLFKENTTSKK
ncbi:MAG: hypothetical protein CMP76_16585 [Flavobacterium sp.]|uniref:hypothetical protein n=1 Tax=Flavobacterium sp. TaxID=239 RepID=UPI000C6A2387|nr:hypothetical protein [Flavobacterium sp.]MBF04900.1 hypothetical protein [Flavobacterium sp.]|tara:strand:- start:835 stop:1680 length:846 start_codon:yes stop_codon:yes gene_type:complete